MNIPVVILATTLLLGVPSASFSQNVKSPQETTKEKEVRAKQQQDKANREAKEANASSKKEAKEAGKELKETAREEKQEAYREARELSKEAKELQAKEAMRIRREGKEIYGVDEETYEKFSNLSKEEANALSSEKKLQAKKVQSMDKLAEMEARYFESKMRLRAAMDQAEANRASGKIGEKEYLERQEKIAAARKAMEGMRKRIDQLKAKLGEK